jgi:hypothetical protein
VPVGKLKEKNMKKKKFASLKSMKKGVGSRVGSGYGSGSEARSISKRYRSGDPDPHHGSRRAVPCKRNGSYHFLSG